MNVQKKHNVNFCGECSEFLCDKVDNKLFNDKLFKKWLNGNKFIKKHKIEAYYELNKDIPHYIEHKENK